MDIGGAAPPGTTQKLVGSTDEITHDHNPETGNALVAPLVLRMFMASGDQLLPDGSPARLPLLNKKTLF
ncbi:hypothetical protein EVAR_96763_1 [Eumeta japonica]|uniref:Uncharacterized protein n=1 Tax=Eumeta variegata TaxID=151549 RepID=A0A4C1WQT4_EUMVA|nr:hypothetical protein EVAR_96763_1 [Eumeta japonica]